MSDIRTEFAVQVRWPDGHTELTTATDRIAATAVVDHQNSKTDGRVATLLSRTVTAADWTEVR